MIASYNSKIHINRDNIAFVSMLMYFAIHFFSVLTEYDYVALEVLFLGIFIMCLPRITIPIIVGGLLLLYTSIRFFCGHSNETGYFAPVYHLLKYFRFFMIPILQEVFTRFSDKRKKIFFVETIICGVLTSVISLYYVFAFDPLAIRYRGLAHSGQKETVYKGIIRFSQVFSLSLFTLILFIILMQMQTIKKKKDKKNTKFIVVSSIAVISVMIVKGQLMTPLIVLCIASLIYYFLSQYRKISKFIFNILLVCIGLLIYKPILSRIYMIVRNNRENFIAMRLEAIISKLLGINAQSSSLDNRMKKISISMSSFKYKPLFGIGYENFNGRTVGCHQDYWDILAVSGIFGFLLLMFVLIFICVKTTIKCKTDVEKRLFIAEFTAFIILGFLDPCLDITIILVVFVLAPNCSCMINRTIKRLPKFSVSKKEVRKYVI